MESFQATGIDDALDLLDIVNAKADKASMGTAAAGIERHPERRFKVGHHFFVFTYLAGLVFVHLSFLKSGDVYCVLIIPLLCRLRLRRTSRGSCQRFGRRHVVYSPPDVLSIDIRGIIAPWAEAAAIQSQCYSPAPSWANEWGAF